MRAFVHHIRSSGYATIPMFGSIQENRGLNVSSARHNSMLVKGNLEVVNQHDENKRCQKGRCEYSPFTSASLYLARPSGDAK